MELSILTTDISNELYCKFEMLTLTIAQVFQEYLRFCVSLCTVYMNRNIEKQGNVMLINCYPEFHPFCYILGANLWSLLHGDVSVMEKPFFFLLIAYLRGVICYYCLWFLNSEIRMSSYIRTLGL